MSDNTVTVRRVAGAPAIGGASAGPKHRFDFNGDGPWDIDAVLWSHLKPACAGSITDAPTDDEAAIPNLEQE